MGGGYHTLSGTSLRTSRIGFGTASLHHILDRAARLRILEQALDLGFCHFDTARMYGHGMAERDLGQLAARRRNEMVIATKFGIEPSPLFERLPWLQYPAKAVRRLGFRARERQTPAGRFSSSEADRNFRASLRALRTDHVDILFLHEPQPREIGEIQGLSEWAHAQRQHGYVRHFGLAGNLATTLAARLGDSPWAEVVQAPYDWNARSAANTQVRPPQVIFGIHSSQSSSPTAGLRGADGGLEDALCREAGRTILIATRNPNRLKEAADVLARLT